MFEKKFITINDTRYVYTIHPNLNEIWGIAYIRKDGVKVRVKKYDHSYATEVTPRFAKVVNLIKDAA